MLFLRHRSNAASVTIRLCLHLEVINCACPLVPHPWTGPWTLKYLNDGTNKSQAETNHVLMNLTNDGFIKWITWTQTPQFLILHKLTRWARPNVMIPTNPVQSSPAQRQCGPPDVVCSVNRRGAWWEEKGSKERVSFLAMLALSTGSSFLLCFYILLGFQLIFIPKMTKWPDSTGRSEWRVEKLPNKSLDNFVFNTKHSQK